MALYDSFTNSSSRTAIFFTVSHNFQIRNYESVAANLGSSSIVGSSLIEMESRLSSLDSNDGSHLLCLRWLRLIQGAWRIAGLRKLWAYLAEESLGNLRQALSTPAIESRHGLEALSKEVVSLGLGPIDQKMVKSLQFSQYGRLGSSP